MIGKTLDGHYGNGVAWTETYLDNGRLDYRESARRAVGTWHFRGHVFCTFYESGASAAPAQRRLLDRHQGQCQLL